MIKLTTDSYSKKIAFLPSIRGTVETGAAKLRGIMENRGSGDQTAWEGITRGTWLGPRGGLGAILHSLVGPGSEEINSASNDLKNLFHNELNALNNDPSSRPGVLLSHVYKDLYSKYNFLTNNQQLISTNSAELKKFMDALKDTIVFVDSHGGISNARVTIQMIEGKDSLGNPHRDVKKWKNRLISTFGSWFPKYYNEAVTRMQDYCSKNPSMCP